MTTLADANRVIEGAFAKAAALGLKPLTVAVVDVTGSLVALQRQAPLGGALARPDIAIGKTKSLLALGLASSRRAQQMAADRPAFVQGVQSVWGGLVPVTGAVALLKDGALVGAVGVSGDTADNDEVAALAGAAAAGLTAEA